MLPYGVLLGKLSTPTAPRTTPAFRKTDPGAGEGI
jgi:hypothetical protein